MSGPTDPVVELYELVLENPSLFGCFIYVANTWNPKTSRYDRALPDRFRTPGADRALANWHRKFFTDWLALPIADKQRDVALYWRSIGGSREALREIGETAIPPLVRDEERKLFIQDLTFVSALL
jgi:hypothetical protein